MHEIRLEGCRPNPLAHYLKALGVLRLVGEQVDPAVRGAWRGDTFVLRTRLSRDELERFFLDSYQPTPIVAPWNGGSGFYPKDNKDAITTITDSRNDRYAGYRQTITAAQECLQRLAIVDKVSKEDKEQLIEFCRNRFPDSSLAWLDAAVVLTMAKNRAKYPPLLGTGGNDGRLDFTNNFMQRVLELVHADSGLVTEAAAPLLSNALFDTPCRDLRKGAAIGQFLPSAAGGANAQTGFDADALINPWDFVLMLEGACCFAAAQAKSGEQDTSQGALSYPFTVRQSGAGYGSASFTDAKDARAEMWLPLWSRFASKLEIDTLLSEGRARVGKRQARNGVDFARAAASLGVDRGIDSFQRIGFQVRNGLAYFATPLARVKVGDTASVRLLDEIDDWLEKLVRASSDGNAPASVLREVKRLQDAILALCERSDALRAQMVLLQLARCEQALARSRKWVKSLKFNLGPIPMLSEDWIRPLDFGQVELRLALALASIYPAQIDTTAGKPPLPSLFRFHLEPVTGFYKRDDRQRRGNWDELDNQRDVTWASGGLEARLLATMQRRLIRSVGLGYDHYADRSAVPASLSDIAAFTNRETDDQLLDELIMAMSLVDRRKFRPPRSPNHGSRPGAFYALLKLCFSGRPKSKEADASRAGENQALTTTRLDPQIFNLAAAGRAHDAARAAQRRLRASSYVPQTAALTVASKMCRRTAAALLFPISAGDVQQLAKHLRPFVSDLQDNPTNTESTDHES